MKTTGPSAWNRRRQIAMRERGRAAFALFQEAMLQRLKERRDKAVLNYHTRWRPVTIRPLAIARDPQTGQEWVLSELRREHYPGADTAPAKRRASQYRRDTRIAKARGFFDKFFA